MNISNPSDQKDCIWASRIKIWTAILYESKLASCSSSERLHLASPAKTPPGTRTQYKGRVLGKVMILQTFDDISTNSFVVRRHFADMLSLGRYKNWNPKWKKPGKLPRKSRRNNCIIIRSANTKCENLLQRSVQAAGWGAQRTACSSCSKAGGSSCREEWNSNNFYHNRLEKHGFKPRCFSNLIKIYENIKIS